MKKIILSTILTMAISSGVCNAQSMVLVNDGYAKIEGQFIENRVGDTITLTVAKEDFDLLGSGGSLVLDIQNIAYSGETEVLDGKNYSFEFYLDKAGAYTAYIGSDAVSEPETIDILYVNKDDFEGAMAELLYLKEENKKEEFSAYLQDHKEELGLVRGIFDDAQGVGEILFGEDIEEVPQEFIKQAEKSAVTALLNDGKIKDLSDYEKYFYIEDEALKEYFSEDISEDVVEFISEKDIKNISELDALLKEAIIVANVNNAGSGKMEEVLKDFAEEIGIEKSKITDSLCSAMVTENFDSIEEIEEFVNDYKKPTSSSGGGGGGGNGGGASKNNYSGVTMPIVPDKKENIQTEVFADLGGVEWAKDAITQLHYKGAISGKTNELFCPFDLVLREEFVKILTIAFEMNLVDNEFPFVDVTENDWCYRYVKTAYLAGITNGMGNNIFGKGYEITRQDLCVMVYNAVKASDRALPQINTQTFTDENEIADYAKEAISVMSGAGIINGVGDGRFMPRANATRAEAAKIIYMSINSMK